METSSTRLKGVFWENGLNAGEEMGGTRLRVTLKVRQEFKFDLGVWEPVKFKPVCWRKKWYLAVLSRDSSEGSVVM